MLRKSERFSDLPCYFLTFCLSLVSRQQVFSEAENISAVHVRQFVSYFQKSLFMKAVCSVTQSNFVFLVFNIC